MRVKHFCFVSILLGTTLALSQDNSEQESEQKSKTHLWARLSHDHSTRQKRNTRQLLEFEGEEQLPPLFQDVSFFCHL